MNAQVVEQVRRSRREQGLSETVEDGRLLELLAREVSASGPGA